ncbi:MAG: class I SAM-dependent methyltransferase [Nitrospirota bacterium]|nr:class I SAM-dependent methyltransferase [Nitrospirota bacterium]
MGLAQGIPGGRNRGFWNERKARWYRDGQRLSNFAPTVMNVLRPSLGGCESALDIGAGVGSLSIPLARELRHVTALEPSAAMMALLRDEVAREGINNISFEESAWGKAGLSPADLIVSANVPAIYDESFLREVTGLARQRVALIVSAGPEQDKFYYREIYPLLFGEEFPPRSDYLEIYTLLHRMQIYADVSIVRYDFDQPFSSLDEAVAFWKEYIPLEDDRHDALLADYLSKKLEPTANGLLARFNKRSAVITWNSR